MHTLPRYPPTVTYLGRTCRGLAPTRSSATPWPHARGGRRLKSRGVNEVIKSTGGSALAVETRRAPTIATLHRHVHGYGQAGLGHGMESGLGVEYLTPTSLCLSASPRLSDNTRRTQSLILTSHLSPLTSQPHPRALESLSMLTQTLLAGFGLFASSASAQSLLSVLQNNGHTEFARLLQEQGAVIESVPDARLIVYAPPNAAIARNGGAIIARQTTGTDATAAALLSYAKDTAVELRRRTDPPAEKCPVWVYETLLSDPAFVNLGPGRNQTIVQKDVGASAVGVVFTGLGDSVKITSNDIPFGGGVVRPIAG